MKKFKRVEESLLISKGQCNNIMPNCYRSNYNLFLQIEDFNRRAMTRNMSENSFLLYLMRYSRVH